MHWHVVLSNLWPSAISHCHADVRALTNSKVYLDPELNFNERKNGLGVGPNASFYTRAMHQNTTLQLYKSLISSIIGYVAVITLVISQENRRKLQTTRNSAYHLIRIAFGNS